MNNLEEKIINNLKTVKRDGVDNLIAYLKEKTDYFNAPASTNYHSNYVGGLAEHSDKVVELFKEKNKRYSLGLSEDTIYICGYCHDLCKCNFYKKSFKNVKEGKKKNGYGKEVDNWIEKEVWEIDDQLPLGHGEKSIIILQRFVSLSEFEVMAIRWHMGLPEDYISRKCYDRAIEKYPAITALYTADLESSIFLEV
jgi:hypothetical protein